MITTTTTTAGPYTTNGTATAFAFSFPVTATTDVQVWHTDGVGNVSQLVYGTDYTVSTVPGIAGGTVTTTTALDTVAAPGSVLLKRVLPVTQPTSIRNQGAYYPEVIEAEFDRLTMVDQQQEEELARALKFAPTSASSSNVPEPSEGTVLGWVSGKLANLSAASAQLAANLLNAASGAMGAALVWYDKTLTYTAGTVGAFLNALGTAAANQGASLIGYLAPYTGAVGTTQQKRNSAVINVMTDFGAVGDGVTDDTAAIQSAINAAMLSSNPATFGSASPASGPCEVFFPSGYYKVTSALVIGRKVSIRGEGQSEFSSGARIVQFTANTDLFSVACNQAQGMSCSFENISAISNTSGTGHLIHIVNSTGRTNSVRIIGCTFGTPQSMSIAADCTDDLLIDRCLFDVSSANAIGLGTTTSTDVASNVRIRGCNFFHIPTRCIFPVNVVNLIVEGCQVSHDTGTTAMFMDGYNGLPYQLKNITVIGNNLDGCVQLFKLGNATPAGGQSGLVFVGNNCSNIGNGVSSTDAIMSIIGTWSSITIHSNRLAGSNGANPFILNGGTVTAGTLADNHFENTGTQSVAAIGGLLGFSIGVNHFYNFSAPSVSQRTATSGNAISPGVVNSLASSVVTMTINGASAGDTTKVGAVSTAWIAPPGIVVTSYISAPNILSVSYTNVTGSPIGVPSHDVVVLVTRE